MRDPRGFVLLQVLMLALIVTAIMSFVVRLSLYGRVAGARHRVMLEARSVARTSHDRAASCLAAMDVTDCVAPAAGCDSPCGRPCGEIFGGYGLALAGATYAMDVRLSGSGASCQIQASCLDCDSPRSIP